MLRAIVFDFDGVIANSEPLHFEAYRSVLAAEGIDLPKSDYYAKYLGYDDVGAFAAIASDRGLGWDKRHIDHLVSRKADRMEELEREGGILFPGAEEAVRSAAREMPIAIASGALGPEIHRILDRFELTPLFSAIVAAEDTPASKPSPDPYLRAVKLLSDRHGPIAAAECAAVEDSQWGLQSAHAAGLRTIAVAHTYHAEALQPAELVFDSMLDFDVRRISELLRSPRTDTPTQ